MKALFTIIGLAFALTINAQVITTVAGNGMAGYIGDGGQVTASELNYPYGIAFDASGNYYIADYENAVVRKVNTAGIITTFAGGGTGGDGGQASLASLNSPIAVALDAHGNLFISDAGANVIRKVNSSGIITTFAGTGAVSSSGDGGQATNAGIGFNGTGQTGIALDGSGNLYIAVGYGIRKVNSLGIITTVAGSMTTGIGFSGDNGQSTSALLNNPQGITFDNHGNYYIADEGNNRIRKVSTTGIITTIAGNGTGSFSGDNGQSTLAELNNPSGLTFDAQGNLYITDQGNNRIRIINTSGIINTYAGNGNSGYSGDNGTATNAELNLQTGIFPSYSPNGIAINSLGNLYIADVNNNRIRKIWASLTVTVNSATICAGGTATLTASGATNYNWSTGATGASITVSPTVTTTYTVTGTSGDAFGITTATVTEPIMPPPTITVNNPTVCAGTAVTLTASGSCISYTWSTSAFTPTITVSPTVTTSYIVHGVDTNHCKNFATAVVTIPTNSSPPSICVVSTDSASNYKYNIVYWNNTYPNVDSFIVYR